MSSEFLEEKEVFYTYHNLDGSTSEEDTKTACGYSLKVNTTETYYVKFFRGRILDPYGIDSSKLNSYLTEYKKVSSEVFEYYSNYLETKKTEFLLRAERSHIDV
tara:strand:+ start:113 stop:424 length:312 start_codon:yes stop_codon:yes gene_type:complete